METVRASLSIEIWVECPNKECENYIDLLNEKDTSGTSHNDDGYLLRQIFHYDGTHEDFKCDKVMCSKCKTVFNVKGLD